MSLTPEDRALEVVAKQAADYLYTLAENIARHDVDMHLDPCEDPAVVADRLRAALLAAAREQPSQPAEDVREKVARLKAAVDLPTVRSIDGTEKTVVDVADLKAILAQPVAVGEGWRPIETAPKDGTLILAFCVHQNARYAGEDVAEWTEIVTTRWIDHNGGGWTWNGICGVHTHWQPLPAPPPHGGGDD